MTPEWLTSKQNPDGGWPYAHGGSAAEPTAFALLALHAAGAGASLASGCGKRWLQAQQRPDGGVRPRPNVDLSTWVTALAALVPGSGLRLDAALDWLCTQTGQDATPLNRVRAFLMTGHPARQDAVRGWPWLSGTAAWVIPTAITLLALHRHSAQYPRAAARLRPGMDFLFQRRCKDGGWNHGSAEALGYPAVSYPETTGLALLALQPHGSVDLQPSLKLAALLHASTTSREAAAWLDLGLTAHGIPPPPRSFSNEPRTVAEGALQLIAESARAGTKVLS